ncbi:metalloregulator ArsR/SmtB family transcription factor [Colwelliaceae bacterium 6441]
MSFFKCLADQTRLNILTLVDSQGELCVCELTQALALSQPKISRHIALLKSEGLLSHRKVGKWVFYTISTELPQWKKEVVRQIQLNNLVEINVAIMRLNEMSARPNGSRQMCD